VSTRLRPRRAKDWPTVGNITTLVTATPVVAGREAEARQAIEGLPSGHLSPFSASSRTHFGRLCVWDHLGARHRGERRWPLRHQYTFFSATFDGDDATYLGHLVEVAPLVVEAAWSCGVGYPGLDAGALRPWLERHRLRIAFPFATAPEETVASIQAAVEQRRALVALAAESQGTDPAALLAAFRTRFPDAAS
jgi:hypothetical protein